MNASLLHGLWQSPWLERVGWTLLHFLWQGTLAAAVLAAVLAGLPQAPARNRYLVSVLGAAAACLFPLLTFLMLPLLAGPPTASLRREMARPPAARALVQGLPPFAAPLPAATVPAKPLVSCQPLQGRGIPGFRQAYRTVAARARPLLPWCAALWAAGVAVLSLRLLAGWTQVQRLRRRGTVPADDRWQARLEGLARRLGIRRTVRLLESTLAEVPAVIGWLRPVVLVPVGVLAGLSTAQVEMILAHELAHIRRQDYLVNLGLTLFETFGFYHPAVWWIARCVRAEREHACDDLAVSACGGDRLGYVRALATLEEMRSPAGQFALAASGGGRGLLLARVRRLLGVTPEHRPRTGRATWWLAGGIALLAALATTLGGMQRPAQAQETPGTPLRPLAAGAPTPEPTPPAPTLPSPAATAQALPDALLAAPPPPSPIVISGPAPMAQDIQAPEAKEEPVKPSVSPSVPPMEDFVATVSTADGAPADDDSTTAYFYDSPGSNQGITIALGINQPGLLVNHQKGRFTIRPRADSRTFSCAVTMPGYAVTYAGPFTPPFRELENIHFTLHKGLTASIETVDEAGKPIIGALLHGYYPGPPRVDFGEVRTDTASVAVLEHVGDAPLNVRVLADGFQGDELKNVQLDPAKPYRWTLKRTAALPGLVTAAATGRPVAGATIKLAGVRGAMDETNGEPEHAPLLATSDAQGRFVLTSLRSDCRYFLFVEAPGYSGVFVRELEPSQEELRVSLGPERTLGGKLVHIPDSAFFLGGVPLFHEQELTFADNSVFSSQRVLWLHPKNGESDFSIGPFFVTQRGPRPEEMSGADGLVEMYLQSQRKVRFGINDLPKADYIYDLAEGPGESPAPAAPSKPTAPALPYKLAVTPEIKKAFANGDGIEIRAITGTASHFQVGGTYRVVGVCRQQSLDHATLYVGNTAEPGSAAIAPAAGSSLDTALPRGSTEFDCTFKLLRPGVLHATVYDLDNHDKNDNAYAGVYLGKVLPAEDPPPR